MELLFLTTVLPTGQTSGGEVVSQAFIDALRLAEHSVTVVGYVRPGERHRGSKDLVAVAQRPIETAAATPSRRAGWMVAAIRHSLPYSAAKYRSRSYQAAVRGLLHGARFRLVIVDHAQIGWIEPELQRAGVPFIALLHNVEHRHYEEVASASRGALRLVHLREARLVRQLELGIARRARVAWTLSAEDRDLFSSLDARASALEVVSRLSPPSPPVAKARDVALIGSWSWELGRRALEWFVSEVHPLLPAGLSVDVGGRGGEWLNGSHDGLRYRGFVPDATEFLASARVVAVPSVGGSGVQVKTLDAIATGARVVATRAAVRGLGELPASVQVAADAREFAAAVATAAADPASLEENTDGLRWARDRRERFATEVAAALELATVSS